MVRHRRRTVPRHFVQDSLKSPILTLHSETKGKMNAQVYAETPHLEIQKALAEARRQGAANAAITFDNDRRQAILEDDRNGPEPHTQTFNTNIHPAAGFQWDTEQRLRNHIAPAGLKTNIVTHYGKNKTLSHTILSIGDNVLEERPTPDGQHHVQLVEGQKLTHTVLVTQDGTSYGVRFTQDYLSFLETPDRTLLTPTLKPSTSTPSS